MTAGVYTTTVDILGGPGSTNDWGDPVEGQEVTLAGVPAHIVERPIRAVATESSREPVTVHYYIGRVPPGTPVTGENRLRDTMTGHIYQVDYVEPAPANPVLPQDVRLDLKRVS